MRPSSKAACISVGAGLAFPFFWFAGLFPPLAPARLPSGHFPPRFQVATSTTSITEPIDEDGYPNYEESINGKLSAGISPENNRIVALLQVTGPKAANGRTFPPRFYQWLRVPPPADHGGYLLTFIDYLAGDNTLDSFEKNRIFDDRDEFCENRPWKKEEHPHVAAWLERNRRPVREAILCLQRPDYFHPLVGPGQEGAGEGIADTPSLSCFVAREMVSLLCCQAMLDLGRKDMAAARQSLLSCLRILHSFTPNSAAELMGLVAMENRLYLKFHVLLESASFSCKELEALENEMESVRPFPPLSGLLDQTVRLVVLNEAILVNKTGAMKKDAGVGHMIAEDIVKSQNSLTKKNIDLKTLDYHEILTMINQWFDRAVSDLNIADVHLRREAIRRTHSLWLEMNRLALDDLEDELRGWIPRPISTRTMTSLIGLGMSAPAVTAPMMAQRNMDTGEEKRRLFLTSLALAKYRQSTGTYPESLEALVPAWIKAVPADLFSGRRPIYRKTGEDGFLLYSVGLDRVDSKGLGPEEDARSDDIVIKVPLPPLR